MIEQMSQFMEQMQEPGYEGGEESPGFEARTAPPRTTGAGPPAQHPPRTSSALVLAPQVVQ